MSGNPWKFSELKFPKPDLNSYRDLHKDAIERIKNATSGDEVLEVIFEVNELTRRANDLLEVASIRHSMDTTDERYAEEVRWVDENASHFRQSMLEFHESVYNSPYKDFIEERLGPMYFIKMDVRKKTFCEENIPLRQRDAILSNEYQSIMASCQVEFMGEPRTFMQLQYFFDHEDREVRRAAFKAFSDFLSEHEARLEEIWDELIKVRNQIGVNLGYENYLPVAYLERGRLDYGPEEVQKFRDQVVEEIVPICQKLYEAQAKRLGLDKIMVYDEQIAYPDGNAQPVGDVEYMFDQMVTMLHEMSPETEEFIDYMLDHELIDYEVRPGKAAREYSTMILSRKAPFIFAHFNGSTTSVRHTSGQMGHAFASYRSSRRQPIDEFFFSSADIMEIHVMTMTQFSNGYAERFFGVDADKYKFANLQDLMTFIPFGVAIDEFQHICYSKPELTPKERTMEWRKLEEKYMPWRTYDDEDEFMNRGGYWYHKQHSFLYPLYYIEYCLATVNAMEMYRKHIEHPESSWKEYLALTDVGGSKSYLDILKMAHLTPAYEDGAVKKSISYVKEALQSYIRKDEV